MEMHVFLAIVCLAQLCGAQNSTEFIDLSSEEVDNPEIKGISSDSITVNESGSLGRWVRIKHPTTLPAGVVVGGNDYPQFGGLIHVGRAWYNGNLLPAKVRSDGLAFVAFNGNEIDIEESEVLISRYAIWKPSYGTRIPTSAFPVGHTNNGETLYAGRWFANSLLTPGKVDAYTRMLQMTYNKQVYKSTQYEILILKCSDDL